MLQFINDKLVKYISSLIYKTEYFNIESFKALIDTTIPLKLDDYLSQKYTIVYFNKLLDKLKEHVNDNISAIIYCKLRYVSTQLAPIALEFNAKRKELISEKSQLGKTLPQIKCSADPLSQHEYEFLMSKYPNPRMHSLSTFINACLRKKKDNEVTFQEVRRAYLQWYSYEGYSSGTKKFNDIELKNKLIEEFGDPVIENKREVFRHIIVFMSSDEAQEFEYNKITKLNWTEYYKIQFKKDYYIEKDTEEENVIICTKSVDSSEADGSVEKEPPK